MSFANVHMNHVPIKYDYRARINEILRYEIKLIIIIMITAVQILFLLTRKFLLKDKLIIILCRKPINNLMEKKKTFSTFIKGIILFFLVISW